MVEKLTELKLDGTLSLRINNNILISISDEKIVINDFHRKTEVVVTGGEGMDMIHHKKVHTMVFYFQEKND